MLFAHEDSPAFIVGGFQTALAAGRIVDRLTEAFTTGEGIGWHEHDHGCSTAARGSSASGYIGNLVQSWIPALDGVEAELEAGIRVADVGCGLGDSTLIMAQAFPNSQLRRLRLPRGVDRRARNARAREAGVADRCQFEVGEREGLSGHATTTSSRCSTRCTTWATRPARRGTC